MDAKKLRELIAKDDRDELAPGELESYLYSNAMYIAQALEDAERYRWLKNPLSDFANRVGEDFPVARMSRANKTLWNDALDAAIDAARAKEQGK